MPIFSGFPPQGWDEFIPNIFGVVSLPELTYNTPLQFDVHLLGKKTSLSN